MVRGSYFPVALVFFATLPAIAQDDALIQFEMEFTFFSFTIEQAKPEHWGDIPMTQIAPDATGPHTTLPISRPGNQVGELTPEEVVQLVYEGMRDYIFGEANMPRLYYHATMAHTSRCMPKGVYGSHYCPSEENIYIAQSDIERAYAQYGGDAGLAYIVAHEYAHSIQHIKNIRSAVWLRELQADCLAGYFLSAAGNFTLDALDVNDVRAAAWLSGDYSYDGGNHHGSPEERLSAIHVGMEGRHDVCFSKYSGS